MILPARWVDAPDSPEDLRRYRRIWRFTVVLTLVVSIAPLLVLASLNLRQVAERLRTRQRFDLSRALATAARSVEFIVHERLSALDLLSRETPLEDLSNPVKLRRSFGSLRASFEGSKSGAFGGFVDLGLIDSGGHQICYVGPYDLRGAEYSQQSWFHEVVVRGKHVSDVFMGHRQIPHFVITVKRELDADHFAMLRATLDVTLLTQALSVPAAPGGDMFIVNRSGTLQTPSKSHGEFLGPCTLPPPSYSAHLEVRDDVDEDGAPYLLGYRFIENTPFILMGVRRRTDVRAQLDPIRAEVVSLLLASVVLILLVVLWSATTMVSRMRAVDQKRTEMLHAVEYTNRMATIGRLAATVAHEINNPLAIINEKSGLMKDLLGGVDDSGWKDRFARCIDSITRAVDRGSAVTHRLLGFTRRLEVRTETIDLAHLLREVLGFLEQEARHRTIAIETDFASVPLVESDRGKLQQIFLNLLSNAFAAVEDGGRITLAIRSADGPDRVAIEVRDDGPGIPSDQLGRVFEPFFSTKGDHGTGLGLSITRQLVQDLGGEIRVESEPGHGACFTVELPSRPRPGGGKG
jgi:signal transduction histidine kinase